jgi:hypothetical protein
MPIPLVHIDSCPFTMVDKNGQIVMRGDTIDLPEMPGCTTFPEAAPLGTYRDGNAWVKLPVQPSARHVFDWTAKAWIDPRTLAEVKTARWSEMKRHRDLLEASGFPYLAKTIDSDSRSVQRINTAVQAAQAAIGAGQPFPIVWTCADNSLLDLDAVGVVGMPVALAMYADHLHQIAKGLRSQIEAAANAAQVQAVVWPNSTSSETN